MKFFRYLLVLPSMFIAMAFNKLILAPILIWLFKQVWIIEGLAGITHFIIKLIFRSNAKSINFTIDSYAEEAFSSLTGMILGLIAGLIVIPLINKKIPLICFIIFWLILNILSNYFFMESFATETEIPLKMEGERNYQVAVAFILAGQIIGSYFTWKLYSYYNFLNPFSKENNKF